MVNKNAHKGILLCHIGKVPHLDGKGAKRILTGIDMHASSRNIVRNQRKPCNAQTMMCQAAWANLSPSLSPVFKQVNHISKGVFEGQCYLGSNLICRLENLPILFYSGSYQQDKYIGKAPHLDEGAKKNSHWH